MTPDTVVEWSAAFLAAMAIVSLAACAVYDDNIVRFDLNCPRRLPDHDAADKRNAVTSTRWLKGQLAASQRSVELLTEQLNDLAKQQGYEYWCGAQWVKKQPAYYWSSIKWNKIPVGPPKRVTPGSGWSFVHYDEKPLPDEYVSTLAAALGYEWVSGEWRKKLTPTKKGPAKR